MLMIYSGGGGEKLIQMDAKQKPEEIEARFPGRLVGQNRDARATRQRATVNSYPEAAPALPTNIDSTATEDVIAPTPQERRPRSDELQSIASRFPGDEARATQRAAEAGPKHPNENHTALYARLNPEEKRQVAEAYRIMQTFRLLVHETKPNRRRHRGRPIAADRFGARDGEPHQHTGTTHAEGQPEASHNKESSDKRTRSQRNRLNASPLRPITGGWSAALEPQNPMRDKRGDDNAAVCEERLGAPSRHSHKAQVEACEGAGRRQDTNTDGHDALVALDVAKLTHNQEPSDQHSPTREPITAYDRRRSLLQHPGRSSHDGKNANSPTLGDRNGQKRDLGQSFPEVKASENPRPQFPRATFGLGQERAEIATDRNSRPTTTGRMRNEERSQDGIGRSADGNNGRAAEPATVADQVARGDMVDYFRDGCTDCDWGTECEDGEGRCDDRECSESRGGSGGERVSGSIERGDGDHDSSSGDSGGGVGGGDDSGVSGSEVSDYRRSSSTCPGVVADRKTSPKHYGSNGDNRGREDFTNSGGKCMKSHGDEREDTLADKISDRHDDSVSGSSSSSGGRRESPGSDPMYRTDEGEGMDRASESRDLEGEPQPCHAARGDASDVTSENPKRRGARPAGTAASSRTRAPDGDDDDGRAAQTRRQEGGRRSCGRGDCEGNDSGGLSAPTGDDEGSGSAGTHGKAAGDGSNKHGDANAGSEARDDSSGRAGNGNGGVGVETDHRGSDSESADASGGHIARTSEDKDHDGETWACLQQQTGKASAEEQEAPTGRGSAPGRGMMGHSPENCATRRDELATVHINLAVPGARAEVTEEVEYEGPAAPAATNSMKITKKKVRGKKKSGQQSRLSQDAQKRYRRNRDKT